MAALGLMPSRIPTDTLVAAPVPLPSRAPFEDPGQQPAALLG